MKQFSQRQLQTGEKLRRILADVLLEHDFELPPLSLTEVQVSPDLKYATIFYTVIGKDDGATQIKLEQHLKRIRFLLAGQANLRIMPRIVFEPDSLVEKMVHLDQILKETGDV